MKDKRKDGALMDFPIGLRSALRGYERRAPHKLLQSHPRIVARLGEVWGKPAELAAYLNDLMISDRPDRAGFAADVLSEIFFLKQLSELGSSEGEACVWDAETARAAASLPAEREALEFGGWVAEESAPPTGEKTILDLSEIASALGMPISEGELHAEAEAGVVEDESPSVNWDLVKDIEEVGEWLESRASGKRGSPDRSKLGAILHKRAGANKDELVETLNAQRQAPKRELFGRMLARSGVCSLADVQRALATQQGMMLVDLDKLRLDPEAIKRMPMEAARSRRAIPLATRKGWIAVAVENPAEFDGRDYLSFVTQSPVELVWASAESIERRLQNLWGAGKPQAQSEEFRRIAAEASRPIEERKAAESAALARVSIAGGKQEDATVSDLVNHMLVEARRRGASDIHVEAHPREPISTVRLRVDGDLTPYGQFDRAAHEAVVSRLKILADLDISERRRPQDGKFSARIAGGEPVEARLSVIPAAGGWELATIRLLSRARPMELSELGVPEAMAARLMELSEAPHGLVLVCGPTGSGKTTTLHSLLAGINTPERKIWTVEDPVEIVQPGLCQTQAQPKVGFGFDAALRAFLRADPDVIMVGEIRDGATAKAALEASLTGHLVMSTLHTNSAAETAVRLLDLGADPFALGDALRGILAQRLAKKLCSCAHKSIATAGELDDMARQHLSVMGRPGSSRTDREGVVEDWRRRFGLHGDIELGSPAGCPLCKGTGHRGRVGVYELLISDAGVSRAIAAKARAEEIAGLAIEAGMRPLRAEALELALGGQVSLKEARSVGL